MFEGFKAPVQRTWRTLTKVLLPPLNGKPEPQNDENRGTSIKTVARQQTEGKSLSTNQSNTDGTDHGMALRRNESHEKESHLERKQWKC